jgi:hypothetical protein
MIAFRTMKVLALAGLASLVIPQGPQMPATADVFSIIPTAEARVGRPLTPVSVAGVARRTARRCAAGVYNC